MRSPVFHTSDACKHLLYLLVCRRGSRALRLFLVAATNGDPYIWLAFISLYLTISLLRSGIPGGPSCPGHCAASLRIFLRRLAPPSPQTLSPSRGRFLQRELSCTVCCREGICRGPNPKTPKSLKSLKGHLPRKYLVLAA